MTKREIASLACKLLSLYALIDAIGTLQFFFDYLGSTVGISAPRGTSFGPWILFSSAMPFVLQTTFAVFLWLLSDGLALVMAKNEDAQSASSHHGFAMNAYSVMHVAFAVVGVLCVSQALPSLVGGIVIQAMPAPVGVSYQRPELISRFIAAIVQLVFGLNLLFRAHVLAAAVTARQARLSEPPL